ncbi:3-hydroxyacyl-CoA dehydrogenase NAD-binding domain-containing protein [Streptomyces brevispora]|uniref:3-hydroxyacyl-CoA dehydrogenase NAD-binding domain-containing protein n=1 Tax=Streptomyces brevispora TaxID=887462 RepID=UPI002E30069F|nr:3-hydroxyacyl-CoA dehydrogenase NAD-binding domain-containing protein [Streptomyces brevispora]
MREFTRVGVVGCGLMGSGMAGVWRSRRARRPGVRFFDPVPVQKLFEVNPTQLTSESMTRQLASFAEGVLGKTVVRATGRAGFVVKALPVPGLRRQDVGIGRGVRGGHRQHSGSGMVLGCAHPMPPLRLLDLIGLYATQAITDSMYAESLQLSYLVDELGDGPPNPNPRHPCCGRIAWRCRNGHS